MKKKQLSLLIMVITAAFFLVACGTPPQAASVPATVEATAVEPTPTPAPAGKTVSNFWVEEQPRSDDQGQVVVEIMPQNLNNPGETLDFKVDLNTHSVDLSMDLTSLATLTTDTGKTVQAVKWDAPSGGHHVGGTLSFPAMVDGALLLQDASQLTLTMVNVDVPERVFTWER